MWTNPIFRCWFIAVRSKNVQKWSQTLVSEKDSAASSPLLSFAKAQTWTYPLLAGNAALCCCVWPLCSPDADASRSLSIRLFFMRNSQEPQDLQGWESLVFANKDMRPPLSCQHRPTYLSTTIKTGKWKTKIHHNKTSKSMESMDLNAITQMYVCCDLVIRCFISLRVLKTEDQID